MTLTDLHLGITLYYVTEWVIRLVMLVVVPFRRSPSAAKGWLLLIFFMPLVGLAVYFLIGRPKLSRTREEKYRRIGPQILAIAKQLGRSPNITHPSLGPSLDQAVRMAQNLGHMPILGGNTAELLVDYDGMIDRLIGDIDAAQDHVHLLFYIFANDETGHRVIEALARAAKRGVLCRVLMDAMGTGRRDVRILLPRLRDAGIAAFPMLRVRLGRRIDLRNHRKLAVIDGRIAYTGSQNIVNANFKQTLKFEELMVRVTGPVVLALQAVFVGDWYVECLEFLDGEKLFPEPVLTGPLAAQVLPSGPLYPRENNQRMFMALVHSARERVVITTPYFIPDEALLQALQTAVLRGVEVHLVVNMKADQILVSLAQRSYYEDLLEAGVQLHLHHARFLHAKHMSIDDQVCLIGSSNMDIRSFQLNAEVSLLLYDPGITNRLQAEQQRYFAGSALLTLEEWQQRPLRRKVLENLARLFSPLL